MHLHDVFGCGSTEKVPPKVAPRPRPAPRIAVQALPCSVSPSISPSAPAPRPRTHKQMVPAPPAIPSQQQECIQSFDACFWTRSTSIDEIDKLLEASSSVFDDQTESLEKHPIKNNPCIQEELESSRGRSDESSKKNEIQSGSSKSAVQGVDPDRALQTLDINGEGAFTFFLLLLS